MFLHLSVILFTGGSATTLGRHPPLADTPQAGTPPAQIPLGQTPLGRHPLGRHPLGRHPLPLPHSPSLCSAYWDTVNKRAVRILLECILVITGKCRINVLA